ncbi:hypothetical protein E4U53_004409 [Claviceps sorghi]|nr:hypothetical protein E4U53_004409 [Claviceps sorghi]
MFDPKAVTRASWEPKPRKPTQYGPLVSYSRQSDPQAKNWIKWLRIAQLFCRILELTGALGTAVLLVLVTDMDGLTAWVMRILPGVAVPHCVYAIYHLSRKASGRTPASSAAYHVFAAVLDLFTLSLYAYGAYCTHHESGVWRSRLGDPSLVRYFVSAIYYMVIYQIVPANVPRGSIRGASNKEDSMTVSSRAGASSTMSTSDQTLQREPQSVDGAHQARLGQPTETWMPTDSLLAKEHHRGCQMDKAVATSHRSNRSTAPNLEEETCSDDSEYHDENGVAHDGPNSHYVLGAHPNPRRSHPAADPKRTKMASSFAADMEPANKGRIFLSEIRNSLRSKSNNHVAAQTKGPQKPWKRQRNSLVHLDDHLYSRPYGDLEKRLYKGYEQCSWMTVEQVA